MGPPSRVTWQASSTNLLGHQHGKAFCELLNLAVSHASCPNCSFMKAITAYQGTLNSHLSNLINVQNGESGFVMHLSSLFIVHSASFVMHCALFALIIPDSFFIAPHYAFFMIHDALSVTQIHIVSSQ